MANETEFVEVSGYSAKDIADAETRGQTQARTNIVGGTTAAQANVLEGKTFSSAVAGDKKAGSMYNYSDDSGARGKVNATINPTGVYNIPEGYHRGGKVTANPNQNSGTYTASSRAAALDMGANNTYRYVNTNGVPNTNSTEYTAPEPTDGTANACRFDMGNPNYHRYVQTQNVYNTGKRAGVAVGQQEVIRSCSKQVYYNYTFHLGSSSWSPTINIDLSGSVFVFLIASCARPKGDGYADPQLSVSGMTLVDSETSKYSDDTTNTNVSCIAAVYSGAGSVAVKNTHSSKSATVNLTIMYWRYGV